jgi:hypothetical protein
MIQHFCISLPFLQYLHWYGFSPQCRFMCSFRDCCRVKVFPHSSHTKGRSPVCTLLWRSISPIHIQCTYLKKILLYYYITAQRFNGFFKNIYSSPFVRNLNWQSVHWYFRNPACRCSCSRSWDFCLNDFPHWLHKWALWFRCIAMWDWRMLVCENALRHTEHLQDLMQQILIRKTNKKDEMCHAWETWDLQLSFRWLWK